MTLGVCAGHRFTELPHCLSSCGGIPGLYGYGMVTSDSAVYRLDLSISELGLPSILRQTSINVFNTNDPTTELVITVLGPLQTSDDVDVRLNALEVWPGIGGTDAALYGAGYHRDVGASDEKRDWIFHIDPQSLAANPTRVLGTPDTRLLPTTKECSSSAWCPPAVAERWTCEPPKSPADGSAAHRSTLMFRSPARRFDFDGIANDVQTVPAGGVPFQGVRGNLLYTSNLG